jgi:uncharacterized membrane-anchored protein YjiN (DUF445 family)
MTATSMQPLDDPTRQARLDRMKRWATGMLVAATGVYLVAFSLESRYPWLGYVRATAEAAMVGGLADWFAVTALFRYPLGIPIPHTAIIPARKERVGRSLGGFVQRHFLSREVIASKLQSMHMAEYLATWISQPDNSRMIARQAAAGLAGGARLLRDEDVQELIDHSLAARVRSIQVAPLLGKLLSLVTAGDRHQELLNEAIKLLARGVEANRDLIRARITAESPWWIPDVVDDKIHSKIVSGIERTLTEVRDDPEHPLRFRFDDVLHDFIDKLQTSPEVMQRAEALKLEVLDAGAIRRLSSSVWDDAKTALVRYAEAPETYSPGMIERGLNTFGEAVLADPVLIEKIDRYIVDVAVHLVDRYQNEVGQLIAQTVASWDPEATSKRVELAIGRDLQYIRINGTLVGGLAGLLIYTLSKMFGR